MGDLNFMVFSIAPTRFEFTLGYASTSVLSATNSKHAFKMQKKNKENNSNFFIDFF
jgi:hypothetical protein